MSGSESYVCGKRNLGNGYFEDVKCTRPTYTTVFRTESYQEPIYRKEPIYGTWHTYTIMKWVPHRTHRASGSTKNVTWPNFSLDSNERVSSREETYLLHLKADDGSVHTHRMQNGEWSNVRESERFTLIKNRMGMVLEVKKDS